MTLDWKAALGAAIGLAAGIALAPASAGEATFLCNAPAGHVCQFQINTGAGPIAFALPAQAKKRVDGVTPHADTYCVCDPGPITPDCKAPQLNHWCMGQWMAVDPGLNSENDAGRNAFAAAKPLER